MADLITLEVATPERLLLREQVTEVEVPGVNGAMGILPHHAPLLSELGSGTLAYTPATGSSRRFIAINNGWVEVQPDHVRVLAERAEYGDEVDLSRAENAMNAAMQSLANPSEGMDVAAALNALQRAQSRISAAKNSGATKK